MDRITRPALKTALTLAVTAVFASVAYQYAIQPISALFQPKYEVSTESLNSVFWWSGLHWKADPLSVQTDQIARAFTPKEITVIAESKPAPRRLQEKKFAERKISIAGTRSKSKDLIVASQAASVAVSKVELTEEQKMLQMHAQLRQAFRMAMNTQPFEQKPMVVVAQPDTRSDVEEMIEVIRAVKEKAPRKINHKSKKTLNKSDVIKAKNDQKYDAPIAVYRDLESLGLPSTPYTPGEKTILSTQAKEELPLELDQKPINDSEVVITASSFNGTPQTVEPPKILIKKGQTLANNELVQPDAIKVNQTNKLSTDSFLPDDALNGGCQKDQGFEALTANKTALNTQCDQLAGEGESTQSWKKMSIQSTAEYLSTIYLSSENKAQGVPVFSKNALALLSKLNHTQIYQESAVIFGKVSSQWSVQTSNRSEAVMYFDESGALVSTVEAHENKLRYFLILNVSPGQTLTSVYSNKTGDRAGVLTPVLKGVVTYLDLSNIVETKIQGRVFDASSEKLSRASGVSVKILGQPQLVKVSDSKGIFDFSRVLKVGDYALYAQTDDSNGYTHRQKLRKDDSYSIYRFSVEAIQEWIKQLQGGVDAESGLVIASTLKPVIDHSNEKVFAAIDSFDVNTAIRPETYTLGVANELETKTPLNENLSRFIGVQVPEGPAKASLEDSRARTVWSELFFSSPAVVTVIGPYQP